VSKIANRAPSPVFTTVSGFYPCRRPSRDIIYAFEFYPWRAARLMRPLGRSTLAVASIFAVLCLMPLRRVHAYVDPGSGSYILQLLVATLFGALFAIRVFWARIKGFLGRMMPTAYRNKRDAGKQ
jgi:hypothetical protein